MNNEPKPSEEGKQVAMTQPTKELEQLKKQCEEYLNGWKRAQADYQNLKKETEQKQQEFAKFAGTHVLLQFLPLVDYFKYAFNHDIPEQFRNSEWIKGMKHIQTYLNKVLSDHGITEIKTLGEKFNPQFHEAVAEVVGKTETGMIVEEVSTGFIQHGKLIKHAKVKVAK